MDLLTFEDIAERIAAKQQAATSRDRRAGWDRLAEVNEALSGGTEDVDVVAGRSWRLVRVEVSGFGGVTAMEPLHLDPTPGVTVLCGPNGSGKSSIAEAIELALQGQAIPSSDGRGGRAALWDRSTPCARGVDEGVVRIVLRDRDDELALSARVSPDGSVDHGAVLHGTEGAREIDLADTPWRSALVAARPVFGYAAVERGVQLAKDLQAFLEPLLGLGSCLEALKTGLNRAGQGAAEAHERWETARNAAQSAVRAVDNRFKEDEPALPEVRWPDATEAPADWLAANGLSGSGAAVEPVSTTDVEAVVGAATAVGPALGALEAAERSAITAFTGPLRDLHRRVAQQEEPGPSCPVCHALDSSWASTLGQTVETLGVLDGHEAEVGRHLAALRVVLDTQFTRIAFVLDQEWLDPAVAGRAGPVRAQAREMLTALDQHGMSPDPAVRAAWRGLTDALATDAWVRAAAEAVRQSDRREQWLRARHAAVAPFVAVWELDGTKAGEAASWQTAKGYCLKNLQAEEWAERTDRLRGGADAALRRLLSDVGLRIEAMTVQTTKSDIVVVDEGGERVGLSMLSAGQRNALLLAPLLAAARSGPFGFLILDDPVHAFDQLRVDRLARVVAELGETSRVVVLTHDERLEEHLLAVAPQHRAHTVGRDAITGIVTHDESKPAWLALLDDARETWALARHEKEAATVRPVDLTRGFLRMAIDAALRQLVTAAGQRGGRDVQADLMLLDDQKKHGTTAARFGAVETMHPLPDVIEARQLFEVHQLAWNKSAHGNADAPPFDPDELRDAKKVCHLLIGAPA